MVKEGFYFVKQSETVKVSKKAVKEHLKMMVGNRAVYYMARLFQVGFVEAWTIMDKTPMKIERRTI
jgi:hypothetical protein